MRTAITHAEHKDSRRTVPSGTVARLCGALTGLAFTGFAISLLVYAFDSGSLIMRASGH